jgi:predicted Zn-dependent peptidase
MYEDDPQEKVFDLLGEAVFGEHPLGRAVIGRASVIADTPVADIARFHRRRYVPANVVIAAAGAVDHDALVELASERVPDGRRRAAPRFSPAPAGSGPRLRFERKDTEQYHVCVGGPGVSRHDERRYALRVLDTVFGGTSSSRLFQEVREKRGLAYAVYSFANGYQDSGQVGLYVGTRADNLVAALGVVGDELGRLAREPATEEELDRAKENLKGRVVLSLESTGARMNRLGSEVLADAPLESLDEVIEQIDAVTVEGLSELVHELWAPGRRSVAAIGPEPKRLEEALGRVAPAADAVGAGETA